jgi:hypothetical protein
VALPAFDPVDIHRLATVLAHAALEELISELKTTNAAHPGQERRGVLKELDGADDTRPIPR